MASARLAAEPSWAPSSGSSSAGRFQRLPRAREVAGAVCAPAQAGEDGNEVPPARSFFASAAINRSRMARARSKTGTAAAGSPVVTRPSPRSTRDTERSRRAAALPGRAATTASSRATARRELTSAPCVSLHREDPGDALLGESQVPARGGGRGVGLVDRLEERRRGLVARGRARQVAHLG